MSTTIRLVLVDDHVIVLHGLKRLFESHGGFEVVECCENGEQAIAAVRKGGCDVLVLDLRMPGQSGLDVLRTVADEHHPVRVVLLTAAIGDADVVEAVRLGAWGVVLKESSPDTLIECVSKVYAGEQWLDRSTMSRALNHIKRREEVTREAGKLLTPREIEIVGMIARGLRNREVAEHFSISEGTVKIHLHNVYEKLKIGGRLELMLYAQRKGLV